jgi:murein DD-endopeptidase MepM/ murein hydrolase activator NlpD
VYFLEVVLNFKHITILLLPNDSTTVKQFRIPRFLLYIFLLLLPFFSAYIFWVIGDYRTVKAKIPEIALLQKENEQQKIQLTYLGQRIDLINNKMGELNEFDRKLKIMTNLEENENQGPFIGVGGSEPTVVAYNSNNMDEPVKDMVRSMHQSLDQLNEEIITGTQVKHKLFQYLEDQKVLLASTPSIWPTKGWLSSRFGYRISPFTQKREMHKGIDISTRLKTPVVAPADGIVIKTGWNGSFGRMIAIQHGNGFITKYAHLNKILVKKGQAVKRGDEIGLVGKTGRSTGPHLHYEIHVKGVPVNPLRYIVG